MVNWHDYQWQHPQEQQLPSNRIVQQYDGLQRLTQRQLIDAADDTRAEASYQYDGESNITQISTEHGDYQYGYDTAYRLTQITSPQENTHYQYDKVGNRIAATEDSDSVTASYNNKNQLTAYGQASYQYDANGNTTRRIDVHNGQLRKTEYTYNAEQRLIEIKEATVTAEALNLTTEALQQKNAAELQTLAQNLTPQTIASYTYNPYGQRISKTVAGTTTYYLYSEQGLAAEYDSQGNLIVEYHYKPGSTWMTNPITQKRNGQVYYYQMDHLGTPQRIVENTGRLMWEARQTAFGKTTVTTQRIENNLRFPGQYYDAETGTHYNYYRDYEPSLGRYIQRDPIGLEGGLNTYAYVSGNPVAYYDFNGLFNIAGAVIGASCSLAGGGSPCEAGVAFLVGGLSMGVLAGSTASTVGSWMCGNWPENCKDAQNDLGKSLATDAATQSLPEIAEGRRSKWSGKGKRAAGGVLGCFATVVEGYL